METSTTSPEPPRPALDHRTLFYLACREVYRDGRVGPAENRFLNDLRVRLTLTIAEARTIARTVEREWRAGLLAPDEALEREAIFRAACCLAWVDGLLKKEEQELLRHLAAALGLDEDRARSILRQVHDETRGDAAPRGHPTTWSDFEGRLREEIQDWVSEGILSASQAKALQARYSLENVVTYEDLRRRGPSTAASQPAIVFVPS